LGQWDQAADDFAKAVELGPDDLENSWYPLALLQLRAGRADEYQRSCTRLLARIGPSDAPGLNRMVALICKVGPQAAANQTPSVQRAEKAVSQNPNSGEFVGILGECLYRKGDFDGAIGRLEESVRTDAGIGAHWRQLFLAMAHHRLGHTAQAEAYLKQASDWIEKNAQEKLQAGAELTSPLPWTIRLDAQLLREEAQALFSRDQMRQSSNESAKP
jgi:tetratricopeptide (TPR) repeat protein